MKNYIQTGDNLTFKSAAALNPGDVATVGAAIGIVADSAIEGGEFTMVTRGVFELPKVAALAISPGDRVYWDSTNKLATKTASSNKLLGIAVVDAPDLSASVAVRLNGSF